MDSQELRALQEAYSQVYGLDEVSNAKVAAVGKARQKNVDKAFDKLDDSRGSSQNLATAISKQQKNQRLSAKRDKRNEAVDLYDIILSHLLDEGYADTEEAATAIMVNMSEDWRESIVEDIAGNQYTPNPIGNAIKTGAGLIKKVLGNSSSGGTSTKPGDGKPYPDGPLWDGGGPKTSPKPPVKKGPADRDEPLW
jgi:hypothetical protein